MCYMMLDGGFMAEIKGFHTLWTAPFFQNNDRDTYDMQDYELLTMILSALMWRKNNGPVTMYGDSRAIDFIGEKGIADIWDGGLKEIHVPGSVPPRVFWAAGKLYALRLVDMPSVMVDMDLIVWKNVSGYIDGADVCAIHREGLYPDVYPDKSFFNMNDSYSFDSDWDWDEPAVNTCMLYIRDNEFKNYYVDKAVDFMENCLEKDENLCHMVFAEQRMLALCARQKGIEVSSFFPEAADIERQDMFTHIWGYKNILKFNYQKRVEFNRKLCDRIERDFPEYAGLVAELDVAR